MSATLAWLDHSDSQRRRMLEVVSAFREKNTDDELGLGTIRDAFSDMLFPGTSTLHTRAKYLLFLPWITRQMETDGVPSHKGWPTLKDLETKLIFALLAGGESEGVIGREARAQLKQWPSFMYWGALRTYGLLRTPISRAQFIDSLDGVRHAAKQRNTDSADELPRHGPNWHAGLPPAEDDFLESTTFTLSVDQADYLTDRILATAPGTMLATLIQHVPVEVDKPWQHPAALLVSPRTGDQLAHAQFFSEVMHAPALLYNLMLAEKIRELRTDHGELVTDLDQVAEYRDRLAAWADLANDRAADWSEWDRRDFWSVVSTQNPRVPQSTRSFVNQWLDAALAIDPGALPDDDHLRELVRRREFQTKGTLARLRNDRQLERWRGAAGSGQLGYRWGNVSTLASEIAGASTVSSRTADA